MATTNKKHLAFAGAIGALAAAGLLGTGSIPPIIVHGAAPADAPGWKCEVVGPPLNAQRVCRPVDDEPDGGVLDGGVP